jgi:outer membrane protein assembly factor BamB
LWQRELGDGYSGIAAESGKLFTMYRKGDNEIAVALDAATGKTIWEYSYASPFLPDYDMSNGPGPQTTVEELWAHRLMRVHFTNAIRVGDVVYGSSGAFGPAPFTAIDVKTGKILWRHRSFPRAYLR